MNVTTPHGHGSHRCLTGISAITLAATMLLAAPPTYGAQAASTMVIAGLPPTPQTAGGSLSGTAESLTGAQRCTLALWFTVHNPSINKPRGDQDAPDRWTPPDGPCSR